MEKTYEIYNALIGENIDDAEDILSQFGKVRFVDESIDDGIDDDDSEDEYVMMRSYDVGKIHVRIYYGDNSGLIGCINID